MEIVTQQLDVIYYSLRELPQGLEQLGRRAVEAFGLKERFFHAEFFLCRDGSWRALEVNFRPPGGFTTDMMNYGSDIDIYNLWARVLVGDDLSGFTFDRRHHVGHISRRFGRRYRLSHDELLAKLGPRLMYWREIPRAFSVAMGDVLYLVRTPSLDALMDAAGLVHALT
jgi:hypothetical protein